MANRSYLYSKHTGDEVEFRDVAEWNYTIPAAHLILVGANSTITRSKLWNPEEKIAIEGDAQVSRPVFLKLLDWLEPQMDSGFIEAANKAREFLLRDDRQGDKFFLELGEIFMLEGLELPDMETSAQKYATLAKTLFEEVTEVLNTKDSTMNSFKHERNYILDKPR